MKKEILDAAAAEKKELLEGFEAKVEAAVKKALGDKGLGLSKEDQEEIIAEIRSIFTPDGATQLSRTALISSFKGKEPGAMRHNFVADDNDPAVGELWNQGIAQPFLAGLDAPFTSRDHPVEVNVSLVQDGNTIAERAGTFDLAQVLNAQLAAAEGEVALIKKQIAGDI